MGAPVGNDNAKRGLIYRRGFEAYARANPGVLEELIDWLYAVALRGIDDAKVGDRITAAQIIMDRTEGKPAQAIDLGNTDGEPFRTIAWPLPLTPLDK